MKNQEVVCILTAGTGTRMGIMGMQLNKALFPVDGKAIITHIINKFPKETTFVIALGYLGDQVRQYLSVAHNSSKIIFVDVDNYNKPGSGPGYSLLCCQHQLNRPFYFVSCDTLWDDPVELFPGRNWIGVAPVPSAISSKYCNIKIENSIAVGLLDKQEIDDSKFQAFVGLCHIQDHSIFWNALGNKDIVEGEHQVSNGLSSLISETKVWAKPIDWIDVGDAEKYKETVSRYENYDFSKQNESLYIVNNKVIKFFVDPELTERRVMKSRLKPKVFPGITHFENQFYAYDFQAGETLYMTNNSHIFSMLLDWLDTELWSPVRVNSDVVRESCKKFYYNKTTERIDLYHDKYDISGQSSIINGNSIPPTGELLSKIDWESLYDGVPCFMHGDLQFDNIIFNNESGKFTLLDWRQDFAGHITFGDLYYDFAKLYGGIILNYDFIKLNLLRYTESESKIDFDFAQRYQSSTYINILSKYIIEKGYDIDKVKLIVALIYLNMSPLHHYPFDKMLYSLGRDMLNNQVH